MWPRKHRHENWQSAFFVTYHEAGVLAPSRFVEMMESNDQRSEMFGLSATGGFGD